MRVYRQTKAGDTGTARTQALLVLLAHACAEHTQSIPTIYGQHPNSDPCVVH